MSNDEWSTPEWLFQIYNDNYGFNLDAAASKENTKCSRFLSEEFDAFIFEWISGPVWCNPPYSRATNLTPGLLHWVQRGYYQSLAHKHPVVMLVPGDVSTQYFEFCWNRAQEIHFWNRIKFEGEKHSAKFGSMVVVFAGVKRVSPQPLVVIKRQTKAKRA